jgi:hypothetical protein
MNCDNNNNNYNNGIDRYTNINNQVNRYPNDMPTRPTNQYQKLDDPLNIMYKNNNNNNNNYSSGIIGARATNNDNNNINNININANNNANNIDIDNEYDMYNSYKQDFYNDKKDTLNGIGKIDINDIYKIKNIQEKTKTKTYKIILERVYIKIRHDVENFENFSLFIIPEVIPGLPLINMKKCAFYISVCLKKHGYDVKYIKPDKLFISWEFEKMNEKIIDIHYIKPNITQKTISYNNNNNTNYSDAINNNTPYSLTDKFGPSSIKTDYRGNINSNNQNSMIDMFSLSSKNNDHDNNVYNIIPNDEKKKEISFKSIDDGAQSSNSKRANFFNDFVPTKKH